MRTIIAKFMTKMCYRDSLNGKELPIRWIESLVNFAIMTMAYQLSLYVVNSWVFRVYWWFLLHKQFDLAIYYETSLCWEIAILRGIDRLIDVRSKRSSVMWQSLAISVQRGSLMLWIFEDVIPHFLWRSQEHVSIREQFYYDFLQ